jgi:hypothetical protein
MKLDTLASSPYAMTVTTLQRPVRDSGLVRLEVTRRYVSDLRVEYVGEYVKAGSPGRNKLYIKQRT